MSELTQDEDDVLIDVKLALIIVILWIHYFKKWKWNIVFCLLIFHHFIELISK